MVAVIYICCCFSLCRTFPGTGFTSAFHKSCKLKPDENGIVDRILYNKPGGGGKDNGGKMSSRNCHAPFHSTCQEISRSQSNYSSVEYDNFNTCLVSSHIISVANRKHLPTKL